MLYWGWSTMRSLAAKERDALFLWARRELLPTGRPISTRLVSLPETKHVALLYPTGQFHGLLMVLERPVVHFKNEAARNRAYTREQRALHAELELQYACCFCFGELIAREVIMGYLNPTATEHQKAVDRYLMEVEDAYGPT